jgi:hypothetical protein
VAGYVWFALIAGIACLVIWQRLAYPSSQARRQMVGILLLLAFTDLTHYFWKVSQADERFSQCLHRPNPIIEEVRAKLLKPWALPDPRQGFEAGVTQNMPIWCSTWPANEFMFSRGMKELQSNPALQQERVLLEQPLGIFPGDETGAKFVEGSIAAWTYNSFDLRINAPAAGGVYLPQLYDPLWRITVDDQRVDPVSANFVGMAFPIAEGAHRIHMEYRPLARRLYWPACLAVEAMLLVLGVLSFACRGQVAGVGRLTLLRIRHFVT